MIFRCQRSLASPYRLQAFPTGVPYIYRLNPEPLKFVWNALINWEQNVQGREMIYSIGYRGLNDYACELGLAQPVIDS